MAGRVRILWMTKGLGRGGAEQLLLSTLRHIDRDRFDVEVAYVLPHKDALVPPIQATGTQVHCLGRGGRAGRAGPAWVLRLRRLLREGHFDVVHTQMPLSAAVCRLVAARGTTLVHTEHNVWDRHRLASRWANALTYPRSARTLAVSDSVGRSIRRPRLLPGSWPPVEVLRQGIDLGAVPTGADARAAARDELGLDHHAPVVGTVGNFTAKKDHETMLAAVAAMADRLPGLRLVLVGTGPLEDQLRRRAVDLGLGGVALFPGSRGDVMELLPAFDLFCLSSRFEGLPIALLEAMASGVPCVATAVGGVPEVLTHGVDGVLAPAGDPGALADALARVLEDAAMARDLGAAGRRTASGFDIAVAAGRLQEIYLEVLGAAG